MRVSWSPRQLFLATPGAPKEMVGEAMLCCPRLKQFSVSRNKDVSLFSPYCIIIPSGDFLILGTKPVAVIYYFFYRHIDADKDCILFTIQFWET